MNIGSLLALRCQVADATLLDALQLQEWFSGRPPLRVRRDELQQRWLISQPALRARLSRLRAAGLLHYEMTYAGVVVILRIGPESTERNER
jgi:hypothetical protein